MNDIARNRTSQCEPIPFECIAVLRQSGGAALVSYEVAVFGALAEADLHPGWMARISIAANTPDERDAKLRALRK